MAVAKIPGVPAFYPRETWEADGFRMVTDFDRPPPAIDLAAIDLGAIHYTSVIDLADGDPDELVSGHDDIRSLLARSGIDYYRNRTSGVGYTRFSDGQHFPGYALGYSFAVDWRGHVWEIRGFDYKPAATSGHNGHTIAILMLTDRADPASTEMLASARAVLREVNRRGARIANRPWPHRAFLERTGTGTATACCGDSVVAQIDAGLLDLDYVEPAPESPEPPEPEASEVNPIDRLVQITKVGTFVWPDAVAATGQIADDDTDAMDGVTAENAVSAAVFFGNCIHNLTGSPATANYLIGRFNAQCVELGRPDLALPYLPVPGDEVPPIRVDVIEWPNSSTVEVDV